MFCKSVNGKSRIIALLAVLTIVQPMTPFPCLAVIHGDVELLKTLALQHKANFESLMTWKGEAFEENLSTRGDNYDYMVRNKCIFAYDKSQNAARWNKQPQENRFVVDGKTLRDILASYNSAMVKGKSSYKYSALGQRDGKDVFHLVIDRLRGPRSLGIFTDMFTFDPRYFFSDHGAGHPIYDRLMFMYDKVKDTPEFEWYVKRAADLVTLEVSFGENKANSEKYVFDLSAGGNVLKYHNKGPEHENVYEYEYQKISGVWVPKSFKWMNITEKQKGAGALKTTRTIRWNKSVVNVPFEEDEFTVEKLGVKPGDDICDHTIGKQYKYRTDTVTNKQDAQRLAQEKLMNGPAPSLLIEKWYNGDFWQLDLKGKIVLLDFWGVWCAPCKQEIPFLKKLDEKYSKQGLVIIGVHTQRGKQDIAEFVAKESIGYLIAVDYQGKTAEMYKVWGYPTAVVVDQKGLIRGIDLRRKNCEELIVSLLKNE